MEDVDQEIEYMNDIMSRSDECYCHIWHRACQAACAAGGWAFITEQRLRHVLAMQMMLAAAGASGDLVLASNY